MVSSELAAYDCWSEVARSNGQVVKDWYREKGSCSACPPIIVDI